MRTHAALQLLHVLEVLLSDPVVGQFATVGRGDDLGCLEPLKVGDLIDQRQVIVRVVLLESSWVSGMPVEDGDLDHIIPFLLVVWLPVICHPAKPGACPKALAACYEDSLPAASYPPKRRGLLWPPSRLRRLSCGELLLKGWSQSPFTRQKNPGLLAQCRSCSAGCSQTFP